MRTIAYVALCLASLLGCSACSASPTPGATTDAGAPSVQGGGGADGGGQGVGPGGGQGDGGAGPGNLPDGGVLASLATVTGPGRFAMPGRGEDAIEVVVPQTHASSPPLLIVFHGTGGEPAGAVADFDLVAKAEALGFVAIAPRAGYRGGAHPPDVDHPADTGESSWNMWTASPDANEDLAYVRALIEAARRSWGADVTRVYTAGFSNGAFFSYFVAASMPEKIAGFAAMSAGWTTDACPTRTDADGASQFLMTTDAPAGQDMTCATIFADPQFPSQCRATATNKLRPPTPGARVPFGYVGHYSLDDTVSVAWSCMLAEGLGARVQTKIRAKELDGTTGHTVMADFINGAFTSFGGRTNTQ